MRTNGLKQTWKQTPRHKLMAMVHIVAQHLDIEHGSAEYRAWLEKLAGKSSCKDLTDKQLNDLVNLLKQQGCLERKTTGKRTEPANANPMAKNGNACPSIGVWQCNDSAICNFR